MVTVAERSDMFSLSGVVPEAISDIIHSGELSNQRTTLCSVYVQYVLGILTILCPSSMCVLYV